MYVYIYIYIFFFFLRSKERVKLGAEMSNFQEYLNFNNVVFISPLRGMPSQCHIMNEQLNFSYQENANQIYTCYFNETQIMMTKARKRKDKGNTGFLN